MKNLIFASAFALSTLAIHNTASANTTSHLTPMNPTESVENAMKPRVKIRLSWKDGFSIGIEVTFRTAPGGNDNATGELTASSIMKKGINQSGVKRGSVTVESWSFGASSPSILTGATDIVVTQGATLPDGTVIKVGDRIIMDGNSFSIVSPRDVASGMATGKR